MVDISPGILVVPIIVLTLTLAFYFYLLKKTEERHNFKILARTTTLIAFILNFVWEFVHGPLYIDFRYDVKHISICAVATLADVLIVLLLFFGFGIIYKDIFWINTMHTKQLVILILIGSLGAIFSEMAHVSRDHWSYAQEMPLLPFTNVGVYPVLQFALIPSLVFFISFLYLKKNGLK